VTSDCAFSTTPDAAGRRGHRDQHCGISIQYLNLAGSVYWRAALFFGEQVRRRGAGVLASGKPTRPSSPGAMFAKRAVSAIKGFASGSYDFSRNTVTANTLKRLCENLTVLPATLKAQRPLNDHRSIRARQKIQR
jgi:hypothetical protein